MSKPADPSLATSLCGIALKNPVLAASGTFGYGVEFDKLVDLNALGGLVVKGLSREPIEGNPPPRIYETEAGMINSIGLQNIGVRAFVREKLPALARCAPRFSPMSSATRPGITRKWCACSKTTPGLAGYELNVSCPNTSHGGIYFSSDPALLGEVVAAVKRVARRPVIVKLSPNVARHRTAGARGRSRAAPTRFRWSIPSSRWPSTRARAGRASAPVSAACPDRPSSPSRCAWCTRPRGR